ncbi:vacuolar protein sorting-associated protein 26C [Condylostylus longicornis]|uniref:vacuolar protein sorting-associated protein 26C n=1 Tax=Condylostylus longicornis TaxID=2530218 RepID=UPI00244DDA2F|nr:vacuolar protein sorting-associated protein 26C [Condylostylus longicornis]
MSGINLEIKLKRANKIYYEGELLVGVVQITCPVESRHEGCTLILEGVVNLQLSSKNVGIFETFYNSVKPIQLLNSTFELAPPGKLSQGLSEFHFEFPLTCHKEPKILYETYHGVFVNINYQLKCDLKRSFLAKSISKTQQFCIQYKASCDETEKTQHSSVNTPKTITRTDSKIESNVDPHPSEVNFSISPESLQKSAKERISIPRFLITGKLDQTECCVTRPFTGHLTIQHTEVAIKSIELQLVRVETCGCEEGYSKDATEIQNIQIADGNVCPKLKIPIFMIFPRLFTCPTLITKNFKIEFEINLVIVFKDEYLVTENFPIILKRMSAAQDLKRVLRDY